MERKKPGQLKEEFEPVWEEQYPCDSKKRNVSMILRDILLDSLRLF